MEKHGNRQTGSERISHTHTQKSAKILVCVCVIENMQNLHTVSEFHGPKHILQLTYN